MAKSNKILLARGKKSAFEAAIGEGNLLAGMPFYDVETKDLYIVDSEEGEIGKGLARIGGKEVLVYKGHCPIVDGTYEGFKTWETTKAEKAKIGDTYFVDQTLNPDANSITVGKGDLIVYTGAELKDFSDILYNGKWLRINCGKISAKDVIVEGDTGDKTVGDVITNILNGKLQYLGEVKNLTDVEHSNSLAQLTSSLTLEDNPFATKEENKGTPVALKPGYFIYYVGEDVKVLGGQTIYKYSFIMNQNGTYHVVKIGASGGAELKFKFGSFRDSKAANIRLSENAKKDDAVTTVEEALNNLMSSKADLLDNGKIPLSQIPDTLVGALQFKGTVDVSELLGVAPDGDATKLVEFLTTKFNSKVDDDGNKTIDPIDAGDYFILNDEKGNSTITIGGKVYGKGDWLIYNGDKTFEQLNASSAVDSINGITAAVNITGTSRELANDTLLEVGVGETGSTIKIAAPNAVLEKEEIVAGRLLLSGSNKTAVDSSLKVEAPVFKNDEKLTKTHGTKITDKEGITVEFPYETSRIAGIDNTILNRGETSTEVTELNFAGKFENSEITKYKIVTPFKTGDGIPNGVYLTIKGYKEETLETGLVDTFVAETNIQVSSGKHPLIKFDELLSFKFDQKEKKYVSDLVNVSDVPHIATLTAVTVNGANTNALPKFTENDILTKSVIEDSGSRVKFGDSFAVDYTKNVIEEAKSADGVTKNFYHVLPTTGEDIEHPNELLDEESTINGGVWM